MCRHFSSISETSPSQSSRLRRLRICFSPQRQRRNVCLKFLDVEEEDQVAEDPVSINQIEGNVSFEHISFGYDPYKDYCT